MPQQEELTAAQVARARQAGLLLGAAQAGTVVEAVDWLGALQAQDWSSGLWSLGVRVPTSTIESVSAAIQSGEVLRTWPMRGTIHLVPGQDARWMLELTGRRTVASLARRRAELGLDDAGLVRAGEALDTALSGGRVLTRRDALAVVSSTGVPVEGQAGYHVLVHCALAGVICIGPQDGTQQTFVRLADWAPCQRTLSPADALVELAWRYFRGHGPTTVADFAGWTGLTVRDARAGVAANAGRLVSRRFHDEDVWLSGDAAERLADGLAAQPVRALPGFDEFVLGYKDRTVQIPDGRFQDIVPGGNGVFRWTICADGRAVAIWTRTLRRSRIDIALSAFDPPGPRLATAIRRALERYGQFMGVPLALA